MEEDVASKHSSHGSPTVKHVQSSASRTDSGLSRCSTHVMDDGHHDAAFHSVLVQVREARSSVECLSLNVQAGREDADCDQDEQQASQPAVEQPQHRHRHHQLRLDFVHTAAKKHIGVYAEPTPRLRRMSTPRSVVKRQWWILRRWLGLSHRVCVVNNLDK